MDLKIINKGFLWILPVLLCCCRPDHGNEAKTVFRYNESQGIPTLDPAMARNQVIIWPVAQLFNGLVQLDDMLQIVPCIAKRWEIGDNGKLYTFYLKDEVFFHDHPFFSNGMGRKVTAHDFEYSFNRIMDPLTASPGSWVFSQVDMDKGGFRALNDTVFQIQLKQPFPAFLGILAMQYCSVVPQELVGHYGADFGKNPVGTGPFQMKYWKVGEKLIFVKNPNYFERDSMGVPLPYLDAVAISFIRDKQSEFLEFMKMELDFLNHIHVSYKNELLTPSGNLNPKYDDRLKLYKTNYLNTEYLAIYMDRMEGEGVFPLHDIRLRRAINLGFDRKKMLRYLRNDIGEPALSGFIPKGLPGYLPGWGFGFNPDSARMLVDSYVRDHGPVPVLTLTTTSDYKDLCEFIQHDLADIGLTIEIDVSVGATFRSMVANGKLSFFRASWIADYPDAENYLSLFYSNNFSPTGPNYTHFKDPHYDRLYEKSLQVVDLEERTGLYLQMDQLLMQHAPVVPLYYDQVVRFTHHNVMGMSINPINLLVLKNVRKVNGSKSVHTSPSTSM
jgi:ABC-type transport system substrate-binding protein